MPVYPIGEYKEWPKASSTVEAPFFQVRFISAGGNGEVGYFMLMK